MADVIFGFDVDACQLAYDGKRVLATPSAKRALTSGVNIADPERSTASYETRLYKYALRGFAVGVPGLDMSRVDPALRNAIFTFDTGQLMQLHLTFVAGKSVPQLASVGPPLVGLPKLLAMDASAPQRGIEPRGARRAVAGSSNPPAPRRPPLTAATALGFHAGSRRERSPLEAPDRGGAAGPPDV